MLEALKLFWIFFKIGLFTFGGGYAMIPMIIEETKQFDFINESEIVDFIAISESTPGPFAVNIATFIGYQHSGILGSLTATFAVILPSFIIILLLVNIVEKVKDNKYFKSIIKTVMPLIIGLIFSTVLEIFLSSSFNINNIFSIKKEFSLNIVTILSLFITLIIYLSTKLIFKKKLAPIITIIISASLGISISYLLV